MLVAESLYEEGTAIMKSTSALSSTPPHYLIIVSQCGQKALRCFHEELFSVSAQATRWTSPRRWTCSRNRSTSCASTMFDRVLPWFGQVHWRAGDVVLS